MTGSTKKLLVLLLILAVGGAYNYQRNVKKEEQQLRPYRGYSDSDLQALLEAYRTDADQLAKRYGAVRKVRSTVRPVSRFLILVRTKAPPLPGLTCWK